MPYNFYNLLIDSNGNMADMPPITISSRTTDKYIIYNKLKNRVDTICGDVYNDESLGRIILWANPAYYCEYDIPDNTVIRIPYPLGDVMNEVINKITTHKNTY